MQVYLYNGDFTVFQIMGLHRFFPSPSWFGSISFHNRLLMDSTFSSDGTCHCPPSLLPFSRHGPRSPLTKAAAPGPGQRASGLLPRDSHGGSCSVRRESRGPIQRASRVQTNIPGPVRRGILPGTWKNFHKGFYFLTQKCRK